MDRIVRSSFVIERIVAAHIAVVGKLIVVLESFDSYQFACWDLTSASTFAVDIAFIDILLQSCSASCLGLAFAYHLASYRLHFTGCIIILHLDSFTILQSTIIPSPAFTTHQSLSSIAHILLARLLLIALQLTATNLPAADFHLLRRFKFELPSIVVLLVLHPRPPAVLLPQLAILPLAAQLRHPQLV